MSDPQIDICEDERGQLLAFFNGAILPGVQSIEISAHADVPRLCEIRIRLWGAALKLVSYQAGGSDGVVTRDDDEPRGQILR